MRHEETFWLRSWESGVEVNLFKIAKAVNEMSSEDEIAFGLEQKASWIGMQPCTTPRKEATIVLLLLYSLLSISS